MLVGGTQHLPVPFFWIEPKRIFIFHAEYITFYLRESLLQSPLPCVTWVLVGAAVISCFHDE